MGQDVILGLMGFAWSIPMHHGIEEFSVRVVEKLITI